MLFINDWMDTLKISVFVGKKYSSVGFSNMFNEVYLS